MARAPKGYVRRCKTCREAKPLRDFPVANYGTGNGRSVVCRGCTTNVVERNRHKPLTVEPTPPETEQAWARLRADRKAYGR